MISSDEVSSISSPSTFAFGFLEDYVAQQNKPVHNHHEANAKEHHRKTNMWAYETLYRFHKGRKNRIQVLHQDERNHSIWRLEGNIGIDNLLKSMYLLERK